MAGAVPVKTLVLGANGHIGANLVRLLLSEGRQVRAFVRASSDLRAIRGLDVELVRGDVRDRDSVRRALAGCDRVYHLAVPTIEIPDVVQVAMEGTRNVLELARSADCVERLVYTSSVVTLGYTADPASPVAERPVQGGDTTPYQVAKVAAEKWLRTHLPDKGEPEVVIVKPTTTLGAFDYRPTPANRTIVEFMKKGSPIVFEAGLSVADVEDVARGHLLAERFGRPSQDYILGGEQMKVIDIFATLASLLQLPPPRIKLPKWAMMLGAAGLQAAAALTRSTPLMTVRQARHFVGNYAFYSCEKARAELGYSHRPGAETLRRTAEWFLTTDLIPAPRRDILRARMADA